MLPARAGHFHLNGTSSRQAVCRRPPVDRIRHGGVRGAPQTDHLSVPDTPAGTLRIDRLRALRPLSPAGSELLASALAIMGFAYGFLVLIQQGILSSGGSGGIDTLAYWTAGSRILNGGELYGSGVGQMAAFLYPPLFAQAISAFSLLPFPVAVWMWRGVELLCLRVAVGSWRACGIVILIFPPVLAELHAGNVHLVIAAAVACAIRGEGRLLVPTVLTKFACLAALPAGLCRDPRGIALGTMVAGLAVSCSVAVAPALWFDYVHFLTAARPEAYGWYDIGASVPLSLRLGAAGVLALAATRWARLAAMAATLALPVLWFDGLSVAVAAVARPAPAARPALVNRLSMPRPWARVDAPVRIPAPWMATVPAGRPGADPPA